MTALATRLLPVRVYARRHPVLVAVGGAGALAFVGGLAYLLSKLSGDNVVIYTAEGEGAGEFRTSAQRMATAIGATVYPARSAQDILDAVRRHRRIKRLVLAGHGTTSAFLRPGSTGIRVGADALPTWVSTTTFAREVGPRMAIGGWIGFAGCSTAASPGESGDWTAQSYGPGGERGFLARIRDDLARTPGVMWGIDVGGHTTVGHLSANPAARECPVAQAQIGQPCLSVLDQAWGRDAHETRSSEWNGVFQGAPAEAWIESGEVVV